MRSRYLFTGKRTLIILGSLVLIGILALGYLVSQRRPTAEEPATPAVEDLVKPVITFAGACPPDDFGFKCSGVALDDPVVFRGITSAINGKLYELVGDGVEACFTDPTNTLKIRDPATVPQSVTVDLIQCSAIKLSRDGDDYLFTTTATLTVPQASHGTKLSSATYSSSGTNAIAMSGAITAEVSGRISAAVPSSWQFKPSKTTLKSVDIDAPFTFDLKADQDLSDNFGTVDSDIDINEAASFWKIHTEGTVLGRVAIKAAGGDPPKFSKLEFCPQVCQITNIEVLHVEARKIGQSDDITGTFKVDSRHEEVYRGTGTGNPATGKISWSRDLEVKKDDVRKWDNQLQFGTSAESRYKADIHSTADLKPFQRQSLLVSDINKTLNFSHPFSTPVPPETRITPTRLTVRIAVDKHERDENGSLSRSGTGSISSSVGNQSSTTSGIYDNDLSGLLLVTSPESSRGQRIDPFAGVPERYLRSYLSDIRVPGYFTATQGDGQATVISSRPVKTLPKEITVFNSFGEEDRENFAEDIKTILKVVNQARGRGSNVTIVDTHTQERFLAALGNLKSGWLINLGHGEPTGLVAGDPEEEGEHFIPFSLIAMKLHEKQVKLSVFAGLSCYSGRSPLADMVIGPIGVGAGIGFGGITGGFGRLFGIGTNGFTQTTGDLEAALQKMIGCRP